MQAPEILFANPYEDLARLLSLPAEPTGAAPATFKKLTRIWGGKQATRLDTLVGPLTVKADLRIN